MHTHRLRGNRDDLTALHWSNLLVVEPGVSHPPHRSADGEGFEPPVELPPQRFSRPSQSTALPPILNFFTDGLSNLRFCSLTATQRCRQNVTNARIIQYWGRVVNSSVGGKLLCLRTCGYVISLSPRREPT